MSGAPVTSPPGGRVVVACLGNALRGDDAAALRVAARLRERTPGLRLLEHEREPTALIDAWQGAELAIVVDAVSSGAEPGRIHRVDAGDGPVGLPPPADSTHALGLAEVIELARALGRLPKRLVVLGIEGTSFETGAGLSPEVEDAVDAVTRLVLEESRAPENYGRRTGD